MRSQPPVVQEAERAKGWLRLFVLLLATCGVAAVVAGVLVGGLEGLVIGVALAGAAYAGAATIHFSWLAAAQPAKRTHRIETPNGLEFLIGLRPQLPLMALSIGLGLALFFAGMGAMLSWAGSPLWAVAGCLIALIALLLLPDAIRALTATGRGAVLDAQGLTYRGYSYETSVTWDDLYAFDSDDRNPRLPAMAFRLRPGVTLKWTRRRWLAQFEPTPQPTSFSIPAIIFDQPWKLQALCEGIAASPADHRPHYLEAAGPDLFVKSHPWQ